MIQPLDSSPEVNQEDTDLQQLRTRLNNEWELHSSDRARLDHLVNHQYRHLFEPRSELPPERVPGEVFKIQLNENATPQYRNY